MRYTFRLDNVGSAVVTDLAVVSSEGSPGLQLEDAGVLAYRWGPGAHRPLEPLDGTELERGDYDTFLTLELRQGASCPTPVASLDAIWIRYTVLDMEHEQRVPLVDGPVVRCR